MEVHDFVNADVRAVLPLVRSLIAGRWHGKDQWVLTEAEINELLGRGDPVEMASVVTALTLLANLLLHVGVIDPDGDPNDQPDDLYERLADKLDFTLVMVVVDDPS